MRVRVRVGVRVRVNPTHLAQAGQGRGLDTRDGVDVELLCGHIMHVRAAVQDGAPGGHVLAHEGAAEQREQRDEELACNMRQG